MLSEAVTQLLAIVLVLLSLFPTYTTIKSKNRDLLDPRILFSLYIGMQLGLYPMYVELTTADYRYISTEGGYSRQYINLVIIFGCLGLLLYYIGYRLGENSNLKRLSLDFYPTKGGLRITILAAGLMSAYGFYSTFLIGGFQNYIDNFTGYRYGFEERNASLAFLCTNLLITIGILIVNAQIKNKRHNITAYIVPFAFFLVSICAGVLSGFRSVLLPMLLSLVALYHYKYRRIKTLQFLGGTLILYLASSLYGIYRLDFETSGSVGDAITQSDSTGLIQRSAALDVSALLVEKSESNSFEHPGVLPGLYEALTMILPRKVWTDKPIPQGVLFTEVILNQPNGGVSMSIIGYLFYQGGIVQIFLGMFIFGIGSGFVHKTFLINRGNLAIETLYISLYGVYPKFAEAPQETLNFSITAGTCAILAILICSSVNRRFDLVVKTQNKQ